jgi:hypothetical protein
VHNSMVSQGKSEQGQHNTERTILPRTEPDSRHTSIEGWPAATAEQHTPTRSSASSFCFVWPSSWLSRSFQSMAIVFTLCILYWLCGHCYGSRQATPQQHPLCSACPLGRRPVYAKHHQCSKKRIILGCVGGLPLLCPDPE